MLEVLKNAVKELPDLLRQNSIWRSLYIDYHPPLVERLYCDYTLNGDDYRVNLHRIHSLEPTPENAKYPLTITFDEDVPQEVADRFVTILKAEAQNIHQSDPLYHPHPWPSAMLIVKGEYEMKVGYGDPNGEPPKMSGRMILRPGTMYEMTDPNEWHYVSPTVGTQYTHTIMVTGKPYPSAKKTDKHKLRELTPEEIGRMRHFFMDEVEQNDYLEAVK